MDPTGHACGLGFKPQLMWKKQRKEEKETGMGMRKKQGWGSRQGVKQGIQCPAAETETEGKTKQKTKPSQTPQSLGEARDELTAQP